jgi:hypothetical protein
MGVASGGFSRPRVRRSGAVGQSSPGVGLQHVTAPLPFSWVRPVVSEINSLGAQQRIRRPGCPVGAGFGGRLGLERRRRIGMHQHFGARKFGTNGRFDLVAQGMRLAQA